MQLCYICRRLEAVCRDLLGVSKLLFAPLGKASTIAMGIYTCCLADVGLQHVMVVVRLMGRVRILMFMSAANTALICLPPSLPSVPPETPWFLFFSTFTIVASNSTGLVAGLVHCSQLQQCVQNGRWKPFYNNGTLFCCLKQLSAPAQSYIGMGCQSWNCQSWIP